jgi:hypothetical protein
LVIASGRNRPAALKNQLFLPVRPFTQIAAETTSVIERLEFKQLRVERGCEVRCVQHGVRSFSTETHNVEHGRRSFRIANQRVITGIKQDEQWSFPSQKITY